MLGTGDWASTRFNLLVSVVTENMDSAIPFIQFFLKTLSPSHSQACAYTEGLGMELRASLG